MAVLKADSEALWPNDEDNESLSSVRGHTDDNIFSAQTCEASGWEKTSGFTAESALSKLVCYESKEQAKSHNTPTSPS